MHIHQTKDKTYLLRQSLRDGNTVKKLTLCNLSRWPADKIEQLADALEAKRRGDLQAPARIINLLAEQGVFDEKVLRRGKDKEKWIHLPAEPSLYWQTMTTLQRAPRLPRQRRRLRIPKSGRRPKRRARTR